VKSHKKGRDPYRILFAFPFIFVLWGLFWVFLFGNQYRAFREEYLMETESELKAQGEIVSFWLQEGNFEKLETFCGKYQADLRHFLVWAEDGTVLFDSDTKLSGRPLHSELDMKEPSVRFTEVAGEWRLYCAGCVSSEDHRLNWQISMPVEPISAALQWGIWNVLFAGFIGVILVLVLTHFVAFRLRLPLEKLQQSASRIAAGDLSGSVFVPKKGIMRPLALSVSEMAKQLRRQIGELTVLETYRSDFIANISHEIKTPLTVILSSVETLEDGAKEIPEMRDAGLKMLAHQAERLKWLVQDVLSLASLEQAQKKGVQEDGLQEVALSDIFQNAVENCAETIRQTGTQVKVLDTMPDAILADPRLLEQAVTNLLTNALRYSGSQTIELSAVTGSSLKGTAFAQTDPECLVLSVRDYGIGLAAEDAERIFERFYRVRNEKGTHIPGTGLGLAIVKHIAQLHGGRAEVVSELEKGCDFRLILPRKRLDTQNQESK